jgi:hypothetical protein
MSVIRRRGPQWMRAICQSSALSTTLLTRLGSTTHCLTLLTILGHAAPAPAPTNDPSLMTVGHAMHSSCLPHLSTTHLIGPAASAMQLSCPRLHPPHRRALHVCLLRLQEPRAQKLMTETLEGTGRRSCTVAFSCYRLTRCAFDCLFNCQIEKKSQNLEQT